MNDTGSFGKDQNHRAFPIGLTDRDPQLLIAGCNGSGIVMDRKSVRTVPASSKVTRCFFALDSAFRLSHSNFSAI